MVNRGENRSWFDALRRDGLLFALVATILLVGGLLQPLAEARAAETAKAWIVCTIFGAEKPADASGTPLDAAGSDDCPLCIAGHRCANAGPPADLAGALPAFDIPERVAADALGAVRPAAPRRRHEPPNGIRAPPLSL